MHWPLPSACCPLTPYPEMTSFSNVPWHLDRDPNEYDALVSARPSFSILPYDEVEPHRGALAVFSSIKRTGIWSLARRFRVAAVMAEAKLDLREVRIGPGTSEIEIFALWASVEIIVPPGIRIDVHDSAFMGEVKWESTDDRHLPELGRDAPMVMIRGSVIMSSIEVKVRYLGETDKEAKRRKKRNKS